MFMAGREPENRVNHFPSVTSVKPFGIAGRWLKVK